MSVRRVVFGNLSSGLMVHKYEMENESGSLRIVVTDYGATLLSVMIPDRHGDRSEITLNYYNDLEAVTRQEGKRFLGCIAGRCANRIAGGQFTLDGEEYSLSVNRPPNHLHGGVAGFDTKVWESEVLGDGRVGVRFSTVSPHLEEGYPGNVSVVVEYEIVDANDLVIRFMGNTDRPTILNLTNHAYWNLSGRAQRSIRDHSLLLHCPHYLPVNEVQIPTGELAPVEEHPEMDFRVASPIGPRLPLVNGGGQPGIDHCFVVAGAVGAEEKQLRPAAVLTDPESGRQLRVFTTQPGLQVYTANFLAPAPENVRPQSSAAAADAGEEEHEEQEEEELHLYQHYGVCLETQHFPDSVHHEHFPSVVVRPRAGRSEAGDNAVLTPETADYAHETRLAFRILI